MKLYEVAKKEEWEQKMSLHPQAQFLQSWDWGELQKSLGRKIWRLDFNGYYLLLIKINLPFGQSYLYAPRVNFLLNKDIFDSLKNIAQDEKSIFLRLELMPQQDLDLLGFKKASNVQPGQTLLLDLKNDEDFLLAQMHQKTRYNIRLADKKNVIVRPSAGREDFDCFYRLISDTYNRKGLKIYNKEYYENLLKIFTNSKIYLAEYDNKILAANLVIFYGDTATYLHGGSASDYKNIMAPYLLQWEVIKIAKENGCQYYDFWGIDENKWPGVTKFKKGFGGFVIDYGGAFDLTFNKGLHSIYKIIKKLK